MTFYIVPIVEGQTEVVCIERLLHRIWAELLTAPVRLQVLEASRGKRDILINPDHPDFSAKIEEAYTRLARRWRHDSPAQGVVLLLLDAEKDCPAVLAPRIVNAAIRVRSDAPIACVLPRRMFENWIVAGASTLSGVNGLPAELPTRTEFEDCNGSAWLETQFRSQDNARKYKKTEDAAIFVRLMSLQECRHNAPSFDKLCRELEARMPNPTEIAGE